MSDIPYFIHGRPGGVYPRLEVRELAKINEQWTLFNLGLQRIQQAEYKPVAAKFISLGGIHGLPFQRWSGDPKGAPGPLSSEYGGYCNHASILFPTWHRPYVLALEQSIGEAALVIAGELTEELSDAVKKIWITAAQQLRWPYWDWTDPSTGKEGLPALLKPHAVVLQLPNGTQKRLEYNPLATYQFENPRPDGFQNMENSKDNRWSPFQVGQTAYFKDWTSTYRWPTNSLHPEEQYASIDDLLTDDDKNNRYGWKSLRSNVAHLFTFPLAAGKDEDPFIWDEFSNTTFQSYKTKIARGMKDYKAGSVEHPHNSVHLLLGGLGHMSNNDYAGFDPIFYLHHANIDRILALWEYIYPNYWMGEGYRDKEGKLIKFVQPGGNWSEKPDATVDESSELEPYRNDSNIYWTSNDVHGLQADEGVKKWYTYTLTHNQVSIDVSKPIQEADRPIYLKALQDYFGLDILASRLKYGISHPIIPALRGNGIPPYRFEEVADYRHFIIVADILEHAYTGSYRLEILYNNINIGVVTSLARGLDTLCAGCQGRRETKNRIRGTIAVHQHVVNQIYSLVEQSDQPNQEDVFKEVFKLAFSAQLVGPTGTVLATASNDVDPTENNALPEEKCPNITIHSTSAATHEEQGYCLFFDDTEYGQILEGKWVNIPPEQRV
ncbi:Di-copper centre-containing protein [Lentinula edodes]|uniref:tyrosinase n=1 Tax=Lentinula edodes TaxID=5353 RepID=A0A1Q3EBY1_LENED|nr:Di-copper centre-containing protein [Lentinula edodes]